MPKKTKLYVEQTQRERDNAMEMHQTFQRELCKLRVCRLARSKPWHYKYHCFRESNACSLLNLSKRRWQLATARSYVKVLTDGHGPLSYTSGSSLRLNAQVQGLGPRFKIKVIWYRWLLPACLIHGTLGSWGASRFERPSLNLFRWPDRYPEHWQPTNIQRAAHVLI